LEGKSRSKLLTRQTWETNELPKTREDGKNGRGAENREEVGVGTTTKKKHKTKQLDCRSGRGVGFWIRKEKGQEKDQKHKGQFN